MAEDPVCRMSVDPEKTALKYEYNGKLYVFCCQGGLNKFQKEPEKYRKQEADLTEMHQPLQGIATEWICPMDPEVVSDKPGTCPKCGMALEPRMISLEEEEK